MSRASFTKIGRLAAGSVAIMTRRAAAFNTGRLVISVRAHTLPRQFIPSRPFSTTLRLAKPSPPPATAKKAAPLTDNQYHELANEYLEAVLEKYEELQDENGDIDVEFSAGVMTVKIPNVGTYVLNKQPPNKQIWLASPVTGPKRYDYVISESQGQKQDTGKGEWVYLRDGSTLSELLLQETGIVVDGPS